MNLVKKLLVVLISAFLIFPINIKAEEKTYKSMNLDEALQEEEIEHDFSNYKENDDQAVIYLFRGKGCGYCRKFLTFINSIVNDYGKYFKVVSYEVWYDQNNAELMSSVANKFGDEANGVPYIIIGDKTWNGYAETYDEEIKSQIKKVYNTKKSKRYDIMKEVKVDTPSKESTQETSFGLIAFHVIFALACSFLVFLYDRNKRLELENRIAKLEAKKK